MFVHKNTVPKKIKLYLVSPTKYNWNSVANSIAKGCYTSYDKAKAIYMWLTENIKYDTTYRVYNADTAWDRREGVCQAYCELFYRIGMAVGLDVRIISGKSKRADGQLAKDEHCWVAVNVSSVIIKEHLYPESITFYEYKSEEPKFPSTRGLGRQTAILIDPTWGAGSVKNGKFEKNTNKNVWFDVEPEWFIFTHFPENPVDQLLDAHRVSYQQFMKLPYMNKQHENFGFEATETLNTFLTGKVILPEMDPALSDYIAFEDIPIQETLKKQTTYNFIFKKKKDCTIAVFGVLSQREDDVDTKWVNNEEFYSINYNTGNSNTVSFGVNYTSGTAFSLFLTYAVK